MLKEEQQKLLRFHHNLFLYEREKLNLLVNEFRSTKKKKQRQVFKQKRIACQFHLNEFTYWAGQLNDIRNCNRSLMYSSLFEHNLRYAIW